MRKIKFAFFLFFFFLIQIQFCQAQVFNNNCEEIYRRAKELFDKSKDEKTNKDSSGLAIKKLLAYKNCTKDKTGKADALLVKIYENIEQQKSKATKEKNRANVQTKIAEEKEQEAIKANYEAQRQLLTNYGNDMAFKSELALKDSNRSVAFTLAELAYKLLDSNNNKVRSALFNALYFLHERKHPQINDIPIFQGEKAHRSAINSIAISPFYDKFATGSDDATIKLWKLPADKDIGQYQFSTIYYPNCSQFSKDCNRLAISCDVPNTYNLFIFDLNSHKVLHKLKFPRFKIFSFSEGGDSLAVSFENRYIIFDLKSNDTVFSSTFNKYERYSNVAFSKDNKYLLITSFNSKTLTSSLNVFEVLRDSCVGHMTQNTYSNSSIQSQFMPITNNIITVLRNGKIIEWDWKSNMTDTIDDFSKEISILAFSHDGTRIASTSGDSTLVIWELSNKKRITKNFKSSINHLSFSVIGSNVIARFGDNTTKIIELDSLKVIKSLKESKFNSCKNCPTLSNDERYFCRFGTGCNVIDLDFWKPIQTLNGHKGSIKSLSIFPLVSNNSSNELQLISGSTDRTVKLWNLKNNDSISFVPSGWDIESISYSHNGEIAVASLDHQFKIFNTNREPIDSIILEGSLAPGFSRKVEYSPDGNRLAIVNGADLVIYSKQKIDKYNTPNSSEINCISFPPLASNHPHSGRFVVTGSDDGYLRIWDLNSKTKPLKSENKGMCHSVHVLTFSSDSKLIASATSDTIQLWDYKTGEFKYMLKFEKRITALKFLPNCNRLIVGTELGELFYLDIDFRGIIETWVKYEYLKHHYEDPPEVNELLNYKLPNIFYENLNNTWMTKNVNWLKYIRGDTSRPEFEYASLVTMIGKNDSKLTNQTRAYKFVEQLIVSNLHSKDENTRDFAKKYYASFLITWGDWYLNHNEKEKGSQLMYKGCLENGNIKGADYYLKQSIKKK